MNERDKAVRELASLYNRIRERVIYVTARLASITNRILICSSFPDELRDYLDSESSRVESGDIMVGAHLYDLQQLLRDYHDLSESIAMMDEEGGK